MTKKNGRLMSERQPPKLSGVSPEARQRSARSQQVPEQPGDPLLSGLRLQPRHGTHPALLAVGCSFGTKLPANAEVGGGGNKKKKLLYDHHLPESWPCARARACVHSVPAPHQANGRACVAAFILSAGGSNRQRLSCSDPPLSPASRAAILGGGHACLGVSASAQHGTSDLILFLKDRRG